MISNRRQKNLDTRYFGNELLLVHAVNLGVGHTPGGVMGKRIKSLVGCGRVEPVIPGPGVRPLMDQDVHGAGFFERLVDLDNELLAALPAPPLELFGQLDPFYRDWISRRAMLFEAVDQRPILGKASCHAQIPVVRGARLPCQAEHQYTGRKKSNCQTKILPGFPGAAGPKVLGEQNADPEG